MMRWPKIPRHFMMSITRMQSSSIATSKKLHLDESKMSDNIVAKAFESLKEIDNAKSKSSSIFIINNKIDNATTVEELLSVSNLELINKQHALKVNVLIPWKLYLINNKNNFDYFGYGIKNV